MKLCLILLVISCELLCSNVLVVGDSHTAGYFGKDLHRALSPNFETVATYGHSSSAAIHWVNGKSDYLTGGKFNALNVCHEKFIDPKPIHWRKKALVPNFEDLLFDTPLHENWREELNYRIKPDLVVVALGANDARYIADSNGVYRPDKYQERSLAIKKMIKSIKAIGARCIWVGPPNGIKKSKKNQENLYKYLRSSVGDECKFISSNHYKVTACDGIHFNCSKLRSRAKLWALEVSEFIIKAEQEDLL